MRQAAFFLALQSDCWQVVRILPGDCYELRAVNLEGQGGPLGAADRLRSTLGELDYKGQGTCLGLPSDMVLAARIDYDGLPRKQRKTAMLYRLEEQLPLEAEQFTADFLPAVGGRALGLAAETARIRAILENLSECGIEVAGICPTALLTLWQTLQSQSVPPNYVVIAGIRQNDVFCLTGGRPYAWNTVGDDTTEVTRCIQVDMLTNPVQVDRRAALVVGPTAKAITEAIEADASVTVLPEGPDAAITSAAQAAEQLLAGRPAGWVNLRKDDLALKNAWGQLGWLVRLTAGLFAAFMLVLTLSLLWHAAGYDATTRHYESRQKASFGELYPNRPIPPNVRSRLASEVKRLSGVNGLDLDLPDQQSALENLRTFAAGLPADVRLRILELQVGPTGIIVEGQARSHGDAEVICRSLAKAGFSVDPPRTEHLTPDGVSFTLVGKLGAERQQSPGGGG